ncbi:MAG TPA: recombinase family protein [Solirubrobacteraceae bacterium]|nr:recombinase family protein [Solirubrobacteraceae bacterium]
MNGGTPFKPPIGYLPKRTLVGNQDIRTVIVDKERAPFIQEAFDLYATGNWTTRSLAKHLESRGLRSRPTPKQGARSLPATAIQKLLKNPYYIGVVVYCGRRVPDGRHERLIDPDTFDHVQALLASRSVAGDRPHKHQHYLRGTLYCAICGGRLLYSKHRGTGGVYEYFCCIGRSTRRQGGACPSRHYSAHEIEQAITAYYRTVHVPQRVREAIWSDVQRDADERTAIVAKDIERHQCKIKTLEDNQAWLVQLSYQRASSPMRCSPPSSNAWKPRSSKPNGCWRPPNCTPATSRVPSTERSPRPRHPMRPTRPVRHWSGACSTRRSSRASWSVRKARSTAPS